MKYNVSHDFQVFFPTSTSSALSNEDEGFHQNLGMVSSTPKKSAGFFTDFTPVGTSEVPPLSVALANCDKLISPVRKPLCR